MCSIVVVLSVQTACMDRCISECQTDSKLSVKGLISLSIFISALLLLHEETGQCEIRGGRKQMVCVLPPESEKC